MPALALELDQWPELTIPNANQCAFAALWIRSKGLAQGNVGVGESLPLIWKLPLGDTGTPAKDTVTFGPMTQGVADGTQVTDETGMTPIPRLNFKPVSSAVAGSENTTPRNIVQANAFFIWALPHTTASFWTCLMRAAKL